MTLRREYGFNLIEVLIATVVLTLGLLGVAAMQLTGMRNTQGSYYRSQATTIMNDLAERIYANTSGAINYNRFDTATSCNLPAVRCAMTSATAINACTPAQMAAEDLYVTGCSSGGAVGLLPSGSLQAACIDNASGVITDCANGLRIRITVNWQERGTVVQSASAGAMDAANLENQSISMVIQP